ncbi:PspC domain-containing protein [Pseudarthrobacter sp. J1738]|uniref:PspC domain-containing protein n=1 Tax=Pseudarthrobacter sp. J1738 TaxID=3420446 RepID=UPI003D267A96
MNKFYEIIRSAGLNRGPQRWLGGVCGGIAAKFNLDVSWVRIGFLLLCLLPGPAFVLYAAAWLVLPDAKTAKIPLQSFLDKRASS